MAVVWDRIESVSVAASKLAITMAFPATSWGQTMRAVGVI